MANSAISLFHIISSPAVTRITRFILSSNESQFIHFFSALYPTGVSQTVIARSIDGSHYVIDMKTRKIYNTFGRKEFLAAINSNTKLWCSIDPMRNIMFIREWETPKLLIYQEFTDRVPVSIGLTKDYVAIVSVPYHRKNCGGKDGISASEVQSLPGSSDIAPNNPLSKSFMSDGQSLANFTGNIASADVAYALSKEANKKNLEDIIHKTGVDRPQESDMFNFTVSIYLFRRAGGKKSQESGSTQGQVESKCELVRQSYFEFSALGVISTVFDRADSSQLYIALLGDEMITIDITTNEMLREKVLGYPWESLSASFNRMYRANIPVAGKRTRTLELSAPVSCYGIYAVSSSRESSVLYKNGEPFIEGFPPSTCISPDSALVWFYLNGVFYELNLHKLDAKELMESNKSLKLKAL